MTVPLSRVQTAIDLLLEAACRSRENELSGKVLGLIGYGAIGREIARRAARRGMEVLYADVEPRAGPHKRVLLGELLERSDYVLLLRADEQLPAHAEMRAYLKPGAQLLEIPTRPGA